MSMLTDAAVRNAKPQEKSYLLSDSESLYLRVEPSGSKSWLFRFYWQGKQKKKSFGAYPLISIKEARGYRDTAKKLILKGVLPDKSNVMHENSPVGNRRVADYVQEWKDVKFRQLGLSTLTNRKSTASQIERYLAKDILPVIGKLLINEVDRTHIIQIFRRIEDRGALAVRKKVRSWLYELFQYAMAERLITENPVCDDIEVLFRKPLPIDNNPYLTVEELPEFFKCFKQSRSIVQNQLAVKLLFLTGVRPGELRAATVEQFDLENAVWNVPPENVKQLKTLINRLEIEEAMLSSQRSKAAKKRKEEIPAYVVPLSHQAVEIVRQLMRLRHPAQKYLLSHRSNPDGPVSENTLNQVIARVGYAGRLTSHGIRATISTALNEKKLYDPDIIEAQLSHAGSGKEEEKDKVRAAYNHARYVDYRRLMMQDWADMLEAIGLAV